MHLSFFVLVDFISLDGYNNLVKICRYWQVLVYGEEY